MSPTVGPTDVQIGPAPRGRAGQGGPAAAWYFVYILYYILDIFGYVQFGHRRAAKLYI